jgi:hypothetical protein
MICVDGQLWVDKWHPKTSADLVGNQAAIKTLRDWLRVWNANKKISQLITTHALRLKIILKIV